MTATARIHPVGRLLAWTATLAALDQACKALVRNSLATTGRIPLVGPVLAIVGVRNYRGVSWWVPNLPSWGHALVAAALLLILVGAFPLYRFYSLARRDSRWARLAAVLLASAAAGHLLDGIFAPYTTDWLQLFRLPSFNLADLYAYSGLACLAAELHWLHAQSRGLSLRERIACGRRSRREFLDFLRRHWRHREPGWAWLALTLTLALHVADEATHDFLAVYNPAAESIRARLGVPFPSLFGFTEWVVGLALAVLVLLALSRLAFAGRRLVVWLAFPFAALMFLNGLAHVIGSVATGRLLPGVYSAPLLLLCSALLFLAAARARQAGPVGKAMTACGAPG